MSMSDNEGIKVFYRIFPTENTCQDYLKFIDNNQILLRSLQELKDPNLKSTTFWQFESDGIFINTPQENVYRTVVGDMLNGINQGFSGIITSFGQTGTGKSITMTGLELTEQDWGLVPRIIESIFYFKDRLPRHIKMCVQMSYAEFSVTNVIDLLKQYPNSIDKWHVREELSKIKTKTVQDAHKLLYIGEARKSFADYKNYNSHLNTSVLTFYLTTKNTQFSESHKKQSKLHIIDMAGTDTIGNLTSYFKYPRDIGDADLMKAKLANFFMCLLDKRYDTPRLNGRTNPLVYFLGDDLSQNSILRFIGHLRTEKEHLKITISMLRFGQLLKGLYPVKKSMEISEEARIRHLENEIENLHKEKIQNSVLLNQDLCRTVDQNRMDHLYNVVQKYLSGQMTEIHVINVAEVSAVFKIFKELCLQSEFERSRLHKQHSSTSDLFSSKRKTTKSASKSSLIYKNVKKPTLVRKSKDYPVLPGNLAVAEQKEKSTSIHSLLTSEKTQTVYKSGSSNSVTVGKRSKITSSTKTNSVLRRKSTASDSVKRDSLSLQLLPESLPDNEDAWKQYTEESSYKMILNNYKNNEDDIGRIYETYLDEVKKLHSMRNFVEMKKNELLEMGMVRDFASSKCDMQMMLSDSEAACKESLALSQRQLLEQEETVLKYQSDLKIHLANRKQLKMLFNDEFENYCKQKYAVPLPAQVVSVNENLGGSLSKISKENGGKSKKNNQVDSFRKLMKKERARTSKSKVASETVWKN